jgi:hypothetical protein
MIKIIQENKKLYCLLPTSKTWKRETLNNQTRYDGKALLASYSGF